ncbi:hypothetical protein [Pelagibius sp. Alg239-R121]|uniref:hypothetical protein n=1 Tax=Pelagibius sp. Alg239-R121 TaxID=2993448 RepID=UPI0024A79B2F|nr:hypothetical protein [Pelagibius sp. Alg239-R121]
MAAYNLRTPFAEATRRARNAILITQAMVKPQASDDHLERVSTGTLPSSLNSAVNKLETNDMKNYRCARMGSIFAIHFFKIEKKRKNFDNNLLNNRPYTKCS